MTSAEAWKAWRSFWFQPTTAEPISAFRIFFGLLVLQTLLVHVGDDFFFWYGTNSVVSFDAIKEFFWNGEPRFDLLLLFPTDQSRLVFYYSVVVAAFCVTFGICFRLTAVYLALCLISMHNHMPFNNNGGDSFLKLTGIFLACSNAGDCFSVDRRLAKWRNPSLPDAPPKSPWATRMIQVQLSIVYYSTFCAKIGGTQWWEGTAVYYATRLQDLQRIYLPLADSLIFCKLLSWYTLIVEFAMWTFVWLKEFRYPVLFSALCLHLGIDLAINLPVFEWAFIIGLITFVEPVDVRKAHSFMQSKFFPESANSPSSSQPVTPQIADSPLQ